MAIEQLAEEVAVNLEEAAEVTRKLNSVGLGYFAVGLGVGGVIGFYFGYKFNREKIRAEVYKDAEAEVAQLREIYHQKTLAHVNLEKPPVGEIVQELGYATEIAPDSRRPLRAPVPISDTSMSNIPLPLKNLLDDLPENPIGTSKSMNAGWNIEEEAKDRTLDFPYVIHQNEYNHSELDFEKVVYTYWAIDDVVTDEDERPIPHGDIVVGLDNLKFGHGSDNATIVFVRNDRLETDMKICKVDESFEETVLGLGNAGNDNNDAEDD